MRRLLPDPADLDDADLDDAGLVEAYRAPDGRHLRVDFIASLDGAVTVDGRSGGLGSRGDRQVFNTLRALADVVLVGHGTASTEGYGPITAESAVGRLRASIGRSATAPIAVVSKRASLDPAGGLVTGAVSPTILITCASSDEGRRAALEAAGAVVLVCGDDDVDLPLALDRLAGLGHQQVLCEGGPTLFRDALAARVVDELDLSIAPALVGQQHRLVEGLADVVRLDLRGLLEEDGMLFCRYAVDDPGAR